MKSYEKSYAEFLAEFNLQDSVEAWHEYLRQSSIVFRMKDEGAQSYSAGTTYKYRFKMGVRK